MVATSFETHHHPHHHYHVSEPKMNDIFEQTVIVDKPLSTHFYDHLKEVTIDAEIVVGRKGIVEEIVPLEQWATVISETYTEIPEEDEDWVIEPEEIVYTVVKWEGVEGGEKHIIENRKWTEVAHTPPIHTKHHISPLTGLETEKHVSHFTYSNEDIHHNKNDHDHHGHHTHHHTHESNNSESSNKIAFEKPHVSEETETTWHSSNHHNTTATHQSSEFSNGSMNGYGHTVAQNDESLGAWHKVQSPVENNANNSSSSHSYQIEEHRSTLHKTHNDTPRPYNLQKDDYSFTPTPPTRIPKPRTSPSTHTKSPESPKSVTSNGETTTTTTRETRTTTQKVILKSNGTTVFSGGYSPQPSPPAVHHKFIAAKPACHSTFMTSYTSNSSVSSPENIKSPPRTPGTPEKFTWRRTHGNQYVREAISNSK